MKISAITPVRLLSVGAVIGFSALLSAPLAASASPSAYQDKVEDTTTYTIKRIFKVKSVDRYKTTTKVLTKNPMDGTDLDVNIVMLLKQTTEKVDPSGGSTIVESFDEASVNLNGMEIDIAAMMPTVTEIRDKTGKITIKIEGGNEQVVSQMSSSFESTAKTQDAYYPTKPIKVGDSWDIKYDNAIAGQTVKVTGKATLTTISTVLGMKAFNIKFDTDTTAKGAADVKMHSEGTMSLEVATGRILKFDTKMDGMASGNKIKTESSQTLVTEEVKKSDKKEEKKPE